jgi:hypothetical protein
MTAKLACYAEGKYGDSEMAVPSTYTVV